MKIFKLILLVVAVLIIIPLVLALFIKKDYSVLREITINRNNEAVFNYIKYLKNQNDFSVWAKMDPAMKKQYIGVDANVGFISSWDSNDKNVGKGEQEIMKIDEGKRVDYELRFKVPFESTEQAFMSTTAIDSTSTKVQWGFNGHMVYPTNVMQLFMNFEDMIGKDLQTGLENLKKILESNNTSVTE